MKGAARKQHKDKVDVALVELCCQNDKEPYEKTCKINIRKERQGSDTKTN